jgi:hypothetical protein
MAKFKINTPLNFAFKSQTLSQYGSVSSKNPKLYRLGNQKTNEDVGLRSAPPNLQLSLTVACFCGAVPY